MNIRIVKIIWSCVFLLLIIDMTFLKMFVGYHYLFYPFWVLNLILSEVNKGSNKFSEKNTYLSQIAIASIWVFYNLVKEYKLGGITLIAIAVFILLFDIRVLLSSANSRHN